MNNKNPLIATALLLAAAASWCASSCSRPAAPDRENRKTLEDRGEERPRSPGRGQGLRLKRGHGTSPGPASVTLSEEEYAALEIRTERVARRSMKSRLQALGKVYAPQTKKAIVSYAFPARIAAVHIRLGDWVKPGQRLVTLQSEEVGKAKFEFAKARADDALARSNFEREKRLFEAGVGAQKNLIAAEAELKVAQAGRDVAEKKLHVLGFTEEQVRIISETREINPVIDLYAPLAGKVIENNAVLGAMVDESSEILKIIDPTVLWIDAEVFERDLARVRSGQSVEVRVPAYPGDVFHGRVSYIGDVLKEDTRTITVRAEVSNRDGRLKPGMFADVLVGLERKADCLAVVREAVLEDALEKIVFIRKNGRYERRPVKTGIADDGYLEILEGVEEGEEAVTAGHFDLKSKLYSDTLRKAHVH